MQTVSLSTSHDFLLGGGEMGDLIRGIDWSKTPVGSVDTWPQSLRTAVSIMLNTHFPMYIAWGKEFTQFYNDGYRPILGSTKHPAAMGRSTKFTFSEIWNIIGPMFEGVLEGKAVGFTDFMLPLDRHGFTEECYFIFSYSPIKQEDGSTGGVLVTVTETTERVLGERRLKTLRELGDRSFQCQSTAEMSECVIGVLDNNRHDIPFSLLYSFSVLENKYILEGSTGIDPTRSKVVLPEIINAATENPLVALPVSTIFSTFLLKDDKQPWPETVHQCCCCSLSRPDQQKGFGLLVLGVSPRLNFDTQYQNFFKLLSDQIVTAFTNANAFEDERERAEALAELDRAKTAFFSNISHEFRTPLTLMLGPLEELLHHKDGLVSAQLENVDAAHRNAVRLIRLVNTLLDFSKIESGRMDAVFRPLAIQQFTTDIVSSFRSLIERSGLFLKLDFDAIKDSVYVDYGMWEKIVLNLLSNAFKYTLQGSISVGLHQHGQNVILTIQDTGVGIPEDEIPKMFERFHRIANTAGRSYEGTGIGLSLVAELVKIHQGTIDVSSKVGEGSIFTVTVPVGFSHLPAEKISHTFNDIYTSSVSDSFVKEATLISENGETTDGAIAGHETSANILVVDDNADMIKYLLRILGRNYKVTTASNGSEAFEKVLKLKPDLVISDIMMPVMDGVELLKEIKSRSLTLNIPVILLSARAGEESRIEGYDVGADDYLIKPFSAKELLARVRSQINISKTRSHANKLLTQVFEQTPAAITIIRKDNYVVEFANELYLQIVDKNHDFIGKPLFESLPELKNQVIQKLLDHVLSTGIPYEGKELEIYLNRHNRQDKTYFNFAYHPLREQDGSISGVIVVCFEVTDLVLAKNKAIQGEAELEQKVRDRTAQLEEKNLLLLKANNELEQFAYVASHDLQEPLRKIRTFSSMLQRELPEAIRSNKYFEKIHSSSERMATLIKEVLNYSRLSGQKISYERIDLNKILDLVRVDFELLIEERNAEIISDPLPVIRGNELQLTQLFANLVSNSLKFSGENPLLKISSRTVPYTQLSQFKSRPEHSSYVEIQFKDNGIGFEQKYADQIFVIFKRLQTKDANGTGIGLALCKKIAENHNGLINVESSPGHGTSFFVYLPIISEESFPMTTTL